MFCWNVYDGCLPQNDLSEYRKRRALHKLPTLLDFAGYVVSPGKILLQLCANEYQTFFPSLLAGPTFDFHMYARWLNNSDSNAEWDWGTFETIERRRAASWKMFQGILWLFASHFCSKYCNSSSILTDQFFRSDLLRKVWLLQVLAYGMRTKLYGIWTLAEGACILSGIGYEGIDPETGYGRWPQLQNVKPLSLETATNAHAFVGNWNIRVHNWLYHYVYLRVTPEGNKPGPTASMATFVVSAFWHGQWPGYYLTFMLASIVHVVSKGKDLKFSGRRPSPFSKSEYCSNPMIH